MSKNYFTYTYLKLVIKFDFIRSVVTAKEHRKEYIYIYTKQRLKIVICRNDYFYIPYFISVYIFVY